MAQVLKLSRPESPAIDPSTLRMLEDSLGAERCRRVLTEVCIEMIDLGARLDRARELRDAKLITRLARKVACLGDQVGMIEYARTARAMAECALRGDPVAQAAVEARFDRLGEACLYDLLDRTELGHL